MAGIVHRLDQRRRPERTLSRNPSLDSPIRLAGYAAAKLGAIYAASEGWFDAFFLFTWQIALFISLRNDIAAYGGALALAAVAGAVFGLLLGRHVDAGGGRQVVSIASAALAAVVLLRASSGGSPWLAVAATALGAPAMSLMSPAIGGAVYNLAKASPCPLRFHMATEPSWDLGCIAGCLLAAGLAAAGAPLIPTILFALPGLAVGAWTLRAIYARQAAARREAIAG